MFIRLVFTIAALCMSTHAVAQAPLYTHGERAPSAPSTPQTVIERGAWLYRVAGCVGCHSPPTSDSVHLAGGRDNPTDFGTFYAPNISPHTRDGIGSWTEADFEKALRKGRSPDGRAYWPTFPYMAYTRMSDEDVHALWVYLSSQPAVPGTTPEHKPKPRYKNLLWAWRMLAFQKGQLKPDTSKTPEWNRGRYLVQAVSYCDQCHTPRSPMGMLRKRMYMAGGANPGKGELHPNLTPAKRTGIGMWTQEDVAHYLSTGIDPQGKSTRSDWVMREKIDDSFGWYPLEDRLAIAEYLASLDVIELDVGAQGWVE